MNSIGKYQPILRRVILITRKMRFLVDFGRLNLKHSVERLRMIVDHENANLHARRVVNYFRGALGRPLRIIELKIARVPISHSNIMVTTLSSVR